MVDEPRGRRYWLWILVYAVMTVWGGVNLVSRLRRESFGVGLLIWSFFTLAMAGALGEEIRQCLRKTRPRG